MSPQTSVTRHCCQPRPTCRTEQHSRQFRRGFARALTDLPEDEWAGPIESPFGLHLVRVTERLDGHDPKLNEIREAVEQKWRTQKRDEFQKQAYDQLLAKYDVILPSERVPERGIGAVIRLLSTFALLLALQGTGLAHELRPGFLEIRQTGSESYDVRFKVPARGDMRLALYVRLPGECSDVEPSRTERAENAFLERLVVSCPGGLPGHQVSLTGLPARLLTLSSGWRSQMGPFRRLG